MSITERSSACAFLGSGEVGDAGALPFGDAASAIDTVEGAMLVQNSVFSSAAANGQHSGPLRRTNHNRLINIEEGLFFMSQRSQFLMSF